MKELLFTRKNQKTKAVEKVGSLRMNSADDKTELFFYGDICSAEWDKWSDEDRCPQNVADFLKNIDPMSPLDIYINSGGGDVFGGVAIYNQLRRHEGYVTVIVDGLAASIASVIAMAGDELIMLSGAQMMIHKPWSLCVGDAEEMQRTAELLDKIEENILDIYEKNAREGVTREQLRGLVNAETWMNGTEAAEVFNITVEQGKAAAACRSEFFDRYKNMPEIKEAIPPEEGAPPMEEKKQGSDLEEIEKIKQKKKLELELDLLGLRLF